MPNSRLLRIFVVMISLGVCCLAQVSSVSSVKDPRARLLQQRYMSELRDISTEAATLQFPYPFYFSEILDIDEAQQKRLPTGSVRFEMFHGQTALAISGNYYISYSATLMNRNLRARKTFEDVILPLLNVAITHLDRNVPIDGYAFEIAHHVRSKVLKINTEGPENVMVFIPRAMAERLVQAKDAEGRQTALLESEFFVDGEPFTLWLTSDEAPADVNDHYLGRYKPSAEAASLTAPRSSEPGTLVNPRLIPESELANELEQRSKIATDLSPARLENLEMSNQAIVQKLTADLSEQAHFVSYAPPSFIAFRDGAYLQLNVNTELVESGVSSQYRSAALAFDSHISHLLRPVSKYFHDGAKFEGIDFSTTVRQYEKDEKTSPISVEFVVPFAALKCYENYDCTGQELINRSVVLINGERVTLDLQRAEADVASMQAPR